MLDRGEVARLLQAPRGTSPAALRDRALLELMYACGLRASEATGLELRDLDLKGGVLRARGKGSKERLVPIGREAVGAVRTYLERGRPAARRARRRAARLRQPPRERADPPGPLQDRPAPRARRSACRTG